MWFKNLRIYRFSQPFRTSAEEMEPLLAQHAFKPCGRQDLSQYGWVSPLGDGYEVFTHVSNGNIMLCAQRQDKIVPGPVIRGQNVDARHQAALSRPSAFRPAWHSSSDLVARSISSRRLAS